MNRIRHAIVGAGFGASVHLPAFAGLNDVDVVGLADGGSGRAASLRGSELVTYSDWRKMLDVARPDSLSIAVPPAAQREIVEAALGRGIHVLCEKPLGMGSEDAAALLETARTSSVTSSTTFQFRFEPGMSELRQHILAAHVGRIQRIDFAWTTAGRAGSQRPWSWQHDALRGGGVINAFMPHVVDLLFWLTACEVVSATARAAVLVPRRRDDSGALHEVTAEDMVDALFELSNGSIASIRVTNCQPAGEGMRIEVHGEEGWLRFSHRPPFAGDVQLLHCCAGAEPQVLQVSESQQAGTDSRVLPVRRLAQLFIAATRGARCEDLPTFEDALRMQKVITALRRSAAQRQWVTV